MLIEAVASSHNSISVPACDKYWARIRSETQARRGGYGIPARVILIGRLPHHVGVPCDSFKSTSVVPLGYRGERSASSHRQVVKIPLLLLWSELQYAFTAVIATI